MQDSEIGNNVSVYLDSEKISAKVENNLNNKGLNNWTGGNTTYGK